MTDIGAVTNPLLGGRPEHDAPRPRHAQLLAEGLMHLDYGDLDHVFLVRAIKVPRVRHVLTRHSTWAWCTAGPSSSSRSPSTTT